MPGEHDNKAEREPINVRISPELNKLVSDRAHDLRMSKADLVEKWLYFAATADDPANAAIPDAYGKILDNLAEKVAAKLRG